MQQQIPIEKLIIPLALQSQTLPIQIYIIKNILSSPMQKNFLQYNEQQMMYLYTYYPIYNYFAPFSYAQHGCIQNFNLNLVNHNQNTELSTNASIETLAQTEPKKVSKRVHIAVSKKNKRRHHRNKSKLIQSAKKNCQSNIINHILSFLMKQKEKQSILDRGITRLSKTYEQREKIKYHFQEVLRIVNLRRQRKYINRKTVLCLFTSESLRKQLSHQAQKMEESNLINLDELCYLYRICVMHYMRNLSQIGIMTSKRIQNLAKKIHLRRRSLLQSIFLKEDSKFQPIPSEE